MLAHRERFLDHAAGPTPSTAHVAPAIALGTLPLPLSRGEPLRSKRLFASASRCEKPCLFLFVLKSLLGTIGGFSIHRKSAWLCLLVADLIDWLSLAGAGVETIGSVEHQPR